MHPEANVKKKNNKTKIPSFKINFAGNQSSAINIGRLKFRTLVDRGADVSLMHRRVYDMLKKKLHYKKISIQSQMFYDLHNLKGHLILRSDLLTYNSVMIYFYLCSIVGDKNVVF